MAKGMNGCEMQGMWVQSLISSALPIILSHYKRKIYSYVGQLVLCEMLIVGYNNIDGIDLPLLHDFHA